MIEILSMLDGERVTLLGGTPGPTTGRIDGLSTITGIVTIAHDDDSLSYVRIDSINFVNHTPTAGG